MAPLRSHHRSMSLFRHLFFFVVLSISSLATPATSSTHSSEVSALNVMYNSLNKPSKLTGWQASGGDPCDDSWEGITCSGSSVTEIKLSGLGLTGSLGYQLASLTSVTHFDVSKNNLNGDIPYQIPPNLVHLDLSGNTFTGSVPYSISEMDDLEYLNLANNQLNGQITDMFGKLPKLSELYLSFNHFSSNLPQSFGSLKSLKTLHLQNNQLTGPIKVLANLPLEDLNVENNQFTGPVPSKLKDINNLQIGGTSLKGASRTSSEGKKGMILIGVVVAGVVIAVLVVVVLLLTVLQRRKPSTSASAMYNDEESVQTRSFSPLVENEAKAKAGDSCSVTPKGYQTSHSPDFLPPPPGNGRISTNENEFSMNINSKLSIGRDHATAYSLTDLQAATGSFNASRLLGKGSFGSVYKAKYADGKVLAVKKIDSALSGSISEDFGKMVTSISRLNHPNIAELVGFCSESGHHILVYEFQRNGSLHEFLHLSDDYSRPLTWDTRVRIALGTAHAIEYLHELRSPSSVHKNIKSGNILLDAELNPHLSDCGLTAYYQANNVAPGYSAPECTKSSSCTLKSDIYSFGVVMLELLTGRMPFDSSKPSEEQRLVAWATPQLHDSNALENMADPALRGLYPPKSLSRFADVILRCVQSEPEFRPVISEVVQDLSACIQQPNFKNRLSGRINSARSDDSDYGYY